MMRCQDVRSVAEDYLSGELPDATSAAVREHLDGCPACRAEMQQRRSVREALQRAVLDASALAPSAAFLDALRHGLESDDAPVPGWHTRWVRYTAAAAVLLCVLTTATLMAAGWDTSRLRMLARNAWGDHLNCALAFHLKDRPTSLVEASWTVDPAFGRLQTVPEPVIWTSLGDAQVTERHACVFNGRRYAHIVMRFRGQLVSLLIAQDDSGRVESWIRTVTLPPSAVRMIDVEGQPAALFRMSGHMAIVAGALPAADLHELANELVEPITSVLARGPAPRE